MLDIVKAAKVGRKTFYRHYQDKETLLYASLEELLIEGQHLLLPSSSPKSAEENTIDRKNAKKENSSKEARRDNSLKAIAKERKQSLRRVAKKESTLTNVNSKSEEILLIWR